MATNIKLKRSSVSGKKPTTSDLSLGELGLNTYDGKLFVKIDRGGTESIVGIGAEEPGNTYFVVKNGSDTNDGKSIGNAFASLAKALTVATNGDTVRISPGVFTEIFPLEVPTGVSIHGDGLRSTFIQPTEATKDKDAFLLNGETEVSDLTVGNFFYNTTNDTGYGFRFKSGMKTTTRSPYVQRVTVYNKGSITSSSDPFGFDTPNNPPVSYKSGRGAKIDASVVDPTTLEPAMLFNECTFICPNNTGLVMTNGARTEWVNCFTYFCDKSIDAYDGATGLGGVGKTRLKLSGVNITTTPVANDLIYYLEANYITGTYSRTGTTVTITKNSHGLSNGDRVYTDFTTGTATDGYYVVSNSQTNTFDITDSASGTTSGNVSYKKATAYGTISTYNSGTVNLTNKGTGLFTIASATAGKIVTASGNTSLSTVQKKFGTASLYVDGVDDYATIADSTDFNFGTGDFTIEFWVRPNSIGTQQVVLDSRTSSGDTAIYLEINTAGNVRFFTANAYRITSSNTVTANNWSHIALSRSSGTTRLFVNGTLTASTYADTNDYGNRSFRLGGNFSGSVFYGGYIDELRFSTTARYTATFTLASAAFESDGNDRILLHFDGINGSTVIRDSSLPIQDIRFVSGTTTVATANRITLADYQQFGASMRSIGSASVFGNQGVVGDGPGVVLRLFAYNFGHIGAGKDFSQDETLVNQSNEVVETNNADIQYVSIDQSGDFRVGEAFYVSQNDGTVNFGGQDFTLNSLSDLNVTDGVTTTTITPNTITVGNLQLTGNNINTTSGNLTIDPAGTGSTTINGDVSINGTLTATTASLGGIIQGDTQVTITDTGSDGTISLVADGTTVQTIKSNSVSFAQNVGIGTSTPTQKLEVVGGDAFINSIRVGRGGGNVSSNVVLGRSSFSNNTTGGHNVSVGFFSLNNNTTGGSNISIGSNSLLLNQTGSRNIAIGYGSLIYNTTSSENTAIGFGSLLSTTGTYNTAIGSYSGHLNSTGSNNVYVGSYTGSIEATSRKIIIGTGTSTSQTFDAPDTTNDTQLAIGHNVSGTTNYWIVGDENYNIAIGTSTPVTTLTVAGNTANILIGKQYANANAITLNGSTATTDYNILSTSTNNLVINRPSGKTIAFAQADSTHATFDTSNNLQLNSGKLAIGNFTPEFDVDAGATTLNKSARFGGVIIGCAGNSYGTIGYNAKPSGPNAWVYNVTDTASWIQFLNGGHVFYRASPGWANGQITPLESARLNDSGNFGINTSNPTQRLHVVGDILIEGGTNSRFTGIWTNFGPGTLNNDTTRIGANQLQFLYDFGSTIDAKNFLNIRNLNTFTSLMTYDFNSMSVGVGTESPTEKLDVNGKIKTNDSVVISDSQIKSTTTTRTSSTAQFTADSFSATAYRSTKYLVEVRETSTSNFYTCEILLMHDGTEVYMTQYGTLQTSVSLVSSIDADINSGNVRLLITPSVANTITKISRISLAA